MISAAYALDVPTTTRSGFMKSSTANPSRRNSGLLTTSTRRVGACSAKIAATRAAVPTGTVLLLITIRGSVISSSFSKVATCCAVDITISRSACPSLPGGVGKQNINSSHVDTASARSIEKRIRRSRTFRSRTWSSPGS